MSSSEDKALEALQRLLDDWVEEIENDELNEKILSTPVEILDQELKERGINVDQFAPEIVRMVAEYRKQQGL